jgi:hypothetical protein
MDPDLEAALFFRDFHDENKSNFFLPVFFAFEGIDRRYRTFEAVFKDNKLLTY